MEQANRVLKEIDKHYEIEKVGGSIYLTIENGEHKNLWKWTLASKGSDFPKMFDRMPFGSNRARAVTELTRWIKGDNVRPMDYWQDSLKIGFSPTIIPVLQEIGWPVTVPCVNCGRQVGGDIVWDHYDNDNVGPGCIQCPKSE